MTPLHAACVKGHTSVVEALLSCGADYDVASKKGLRALEIAARQGDAAALSALINAGAVMDEAAADAAFWAAVKAVEGTAEDEALPTDVPKVLHHVFDADIRHLIDRGKLVHNVTCKHPVSDGGVDGTAAGLGYLFDHAEHANLPLQEGRKCEGGGCCSACSRVTFPEFMRGKEADLETFPELEKFNFNDVQWVASSTVLHFVRLVERVRRSIAHEYGLPLATVLPLQAYSRKYVAGTKQQGGGGGEGDSVILHTDEATHAGYHYSCVLYLSTQGEDFEGGSFVWNDPPSEGSDSLERVVTPYGPTKGAAVIFSSGWENMHEVWPLESGTRYAVPCFFTTCPVPEVGYEEQGGVPRTDEAVADDLQFLLFERRNESPIQSAGRVKELLMKWHYLLARRDDE